jgi:hypothetical protein
MNPAALNLVVVNESQQPVRAYQEQRFTVIWVSARLVAMAAGVCFQCPSSFYTSDTRKYMNYTEEATLN